jgi:hypothetical protein
MELNDLIPKKRNIAGNCEVKGDMLYYRQNHVSPLVPLAYVSQDEVAYVFADLRIKKACIAVIQDIISKGMRLYLAYPDSSSPKGVSSFKYKVIRHYLLVYADIKWRKDFDKIGFDLPKNLVEWVSECSDMSLLKEVYDEISKEVEAHHYDWYAKRDVYIYDDETRGIWPGLWREIQISQLF